MLYILHSRLSHIITEIIRLDNLASDYLHRKTRPRLLFHHDNFLASSVIVKNHTWKRKPTEQPDKSNEDDIDKASEATTKKAKVNVKSKKGAKKGLPAVLAKQCR